MRRDLLRIGGAILLCVLVTACEEGFLEESDESIAAVGVDTSPVELRYFGSWDIEQVWLITSPAPPNATEMDRRLLTADLLPYDTDLRPINDTSQVPLHDVSLYLELERTSQAPEATSPDFYTIEYAKNRPALPEPESIYTGEFEVGVNHLGEQWELLKETAFIFGNGANNPSWPFRDQQWLFEQVYRGPDGGLHLYTPGQSMSAEEWIDPVPVPVSWGSDLAYSRYDFVDFERDPPTRHCPIDDNDLVIYDRNPEIPDIVEHWAPVIYQDIDEDNIGSDLITSVDFDGNQLGADNATNSRSHPLPGVVYYSLVRGARHDFIGYYFYHAEDTTGWTGGGGHEHDFEGVVIAYNRCTRHVDSVLTNQHGAYMSYVAADNAPYEAPDRLPLMDGEGLAGVRLRHGFTNEDGLYPDDRVFTLQTRSFTVSGTEHTDHALAVGVEANTHAVWGQWDSTCVIGPYGRFGFGCDPYQHGGDGVIYVYDDFPQVPQPPYPQWPNWPTNSYILIDIANLWDFAHLTTSCGQDGDTHLFACESNPPPWDTFNSAEGDDTGNLPWTWGTSGVIEHVCRNAPNMLLDPAAIFLDHYVYPIGDFIVGYYVSNPYASSSTCD